MFGPVITRLIVAGAILAFFGTIIAIMIFVGNKRRGNSIAKLLEDDMNANYTRSRDIEADKFFTPDFSVLPIRSTAKGAILQKQEMVIGSASKKMVYFSKQMSNIELKSRYGLATLDKITSYEENYTRYISALISWAEALLDNGGHEQKKDAIAILENTVSLGSDYRKTYKLLADHYVENADVKGLDYLLDGIRSAFRDEGIKRSLLNYITDKQEAIL